MNMHSIIYLDHSATTPLRPEVFAAMEPWLREGFGNAGSVHWAGRRARAGVDDARSHVAALINADPREIVFTSGGTEADNLAIRGVVEASPRAHKHLAAAAVEHHAVLHPVEALAVRPDVTADVLPVDGDGIVAPEAAGDTLTADTVLVSVMTVNNETGVRQPIEKIGEACAGRGVLFHTDAVQAAGAIPLDVRVMPVDLMSLSAHKLNGPKGVGALYVRKGVDLTPQLVGGPQERSRRAGTENTAGVVGFGEACRLALRERGERAAALQRLRDRLEAGIRAALPEARIHGRAAPRAPHILNARFPGVEGESLLMALDAQGIAASSGAACASGSLDPSHVLLAMGLTHAEAQSALRFSFGWGNTEAQIDAVLETLTACVKRLRGSAPLTPADG